MTPTFRRSVAAMALAAIAGCASMPPPVIITPEEEAEPERVQVPTPLIEYPPLEPVEPPLAAVVPPAPTLETTPSGAIAPATLAMAAPAPAPAPRETLVEDTELILLLADLQRYGNLGPDDVRREITTMTAVLGRQRTDANRVRLAVLYTVSRASPQDDQRALQLLENVSKSNPGSPAVKTLAVVLQAQIAGRQKAVRDEQQKADAALQKLEALRQMERSLLRERSRSGGGAGGGGGSGGSGGGGGGGSGN
jgi:hypothetical protein